MKMKSRMKQLLSLFLALTTFVTFGQELPKEKLYEAKKQLREGNKAYKKKNYADAAIAYQKSLVEDGAYYKGAYNLGNAFFKQKKYKEAVEQYQLANKLAKTKKNKAKTNELIGDSFKNQKDLEKALEAYKKALLKDPKNDVLRQKFIAAKQAKQKQDQQQKDNKNDKNKDKNKENKEDNKENKDNKDGDNKKDGDKKDNEDKKDNKDGKDKKDSEKDKEGDKKDEENKKDQNSDKKGDKGDQKKKQGEQAQPQKSKLSPQQIQQLLESMSNEEQKTQKKVTAQKVKVKGNKNEKDW